MQLGANPHCVRMYKEKVRAKKNWSLQYDLSIFPSSQWLTAFEGPMEQKVLEDLFTWLSDPVRDFKKLTILSSSS